MPPQAAIAGTGFIGRVHARSVRLAGAELAGVAASSPQSAAAAASELGAQPSLRLGRGDGARPGHRRRPHLHAERPPSPAGGGGAGRRQARGLREAARPRRGGSEAPRRRRGRLGTAGGGAVRLPLLPHRPRSARARPERTDRRSAPAARHLPPGLAAATGRHELEGGRRTGRRLEGVRGHRLALVRPRRVRLRPSHHAPLRASADRGAGPGRATRIGARSGRA